VDVVVCGAQKPFVRGGAELHQENLVRAIAEDGHRAELVRLPVAWEKGRLFDAPLAWRLLPIDADLVIATNFPSYYVRHPRKVVWLFHQHRGAYDAADASWSDFGLDDDSLETQRLLTEWDSRALEEAERLYTTSGVVAQRLRRFNGLTGKPLYHPPPLHRQLRPGPFGDYVFCAARLEVNKRPQLMIDSIARCESNVRLVIAGRGELMEELRGKVDQQDLGERVELRGFVSDDELIDLYAGAFAVLYVPLDEDYGYVTLQAFFAGKPVITARDSGGTLEWVEDGVTGLVTDPSPESIAAAVTRLSDDRALAERLGAAGRESVAELGWQPVVRELLAT
jgi:glycosyltransferase involved in cell wall biosynthesis